MYICPQAEYRSMHTKKKKVVVNISTEGVRVSLDRKVCEVHINANRSAGTYIEIEIFLDQMKATYPQP